MCQFKPGGTPKKYDEHSHHIKTGSTPQEFKLIKVKIIKTGS